MTEEQFLHLKIIVSSFIQFDITSGKEIKYEDIQGYIDRALSMLNLVCTDDDNNKVFTDIEYQFKITHAKGNVIFDNYENRQDWYSNDSIKEPFFWPRYKQYLLTHTKINSRSINLLDEETLPNIMNCLSNPKDRFETINPRRGLIIGDVQSGKTATYTGLICKAADAGYKVVILLAGITESLRQQTQERIDEGIIGRTIKKVKGKVQPFKTVGVGEDNKGNRASSFTSCAYDFTGNCDKIAMSLSSHNSLVMFVVKKNVSVLKKLYNWLYDQNVDPVKGYIDLPMLVIDDEADNASVNTKKDETNPTLTNKLIRQICNLFNNTTYVGFTATPFANVFIDPDSVDAMNQADLFPEHFIYALEPPSNYVGASKIFYEDSPYFHNLRYITDIEEPDYTSDEYHDAVENDIDSLNEGPFYYRHKKEWDGVLPQSLREAVLCFFLANVIRDLRGQTREPRSMLVNMSRFVKVQRIITAHIELIYQSIIDDIRYNFKDDSSQNTSLPLYLELQRLWYKHFNIRDITFDRVIEKQMLLMAIENIKVITVNGSKQSGSLDYRNNKSLRVIAVGGLALSRGLTLEGLIVSYFYRNTATFDVLMQMGRWFGYRSGYEDLFQIWTSQTSAEWYAEVARSSQDLKDDIKKMFDQRLTPKDFGIKVRDNCDELQITASNKMRSASNFEMRYSFYGNIYDTPYVSLNANHNRTNIEAVSTFVAKMFCQGRKLRYADVIKKSGSDVENPYDGSSRFFEDVTKEDIIELLSNIKCSMANPNFNVDNILEFLNDKSNPGVGLWNVVFEGGDSEKKYGINGLENINCMERSICKGTKNVVQISSRRRVMSGSKEGLYTLSSSEKAMAEQMQKKLWEEAGENFENRQIPQKAYFQFLPDRKPILVIMFIHPKDPKTEEDNRMKTFRKALGDDCIVAFAMGLPGVRNAESSVKYKINKVFQKLNIEDSEEEEVEDEE